VPSLEEGKPTLNISSDDELKMKGKEIIQN
jgi:hypothetical protein